jgi:preprotein translocase subunit SecE
MENTNNKIITVSFMITAILIGIVAFVLVDSLAAVGTGSFGRFFGGDLVRHGLPVAIGLIAFGILQFNKGIMAWANEVTTELRKIVWPSRRDTVAMTVMVCVMLVISGLILGAFDVISGSLIDWLLHHNFSGII